MHSRLCALALVSLVSLSAGCRATGRSFLVFGGSASPQEELVARVQGARQESGEAREDFAAAFHLYQRLTTPQAVELAELAEDYGDALERCQERAEELEERIAAVAQAGDELFTGWNEELARFTGDTLREKSAAMLSDTRARTERVLAALRRVEERMDPFVLELVDYALFFNHNLNARAIATLQDTYADFDADYRALDGELGKAQAELDAFLATFEGPETR